jgi:Flp pilus assembly protein CpaB
MRRHKRRGLIFGLLAFGLAIFTGLLFASQIEALERQLGDKQQVIVVKQPVAPRTLITADMLETREIPRMYAHPSYIQSVTDVADQRVAVVALEPGAIVRQNDVAPTSGLDDNTRAVSIGVNPISVQVDRVKGGSRVDVIVSYETTFLDSQGKEIREKRAMTLLSDIEVLAVDGSPQSHAAPAATPSAPSAEQTSAFGSILPAQASTSNSGSALSSPYGLRDTVVIATLKVSPLDAQKLAYVDTFASDIRLSLRRSDDNAIEPLPLISEEDFK